VVAVAAIANNLGAVRQGRNWRCPCPLGCGYSLSLAVGEDGRLLAHCFGGCDYHEIEAALVEYGVLDDDFEVSRCVTVCQRLHDPADAARRVDYARQLYESAAFDSRIDIYLNSRGIRIGSPVLRFALRYRHRLGVELPAMVAPVVNIAGEQTGIHATFLKPDGHGLAFTKPNKGELDFRRQCNGVIRGGVIRLAQHDPDRDLALAEGVESTLSAMEIFRLPGWSTVSANGLLTVELPCEVRRVTIVADRDVTGTGQRNTIEAGRRLKAEGRAVRITMPYRAGQDANDVLNARRR
jgi:hypothetical protein